MTYTTFSFLGSDISYPKVIILISKFFDRKNICQRRATETIHNTVFLFNNLDDDAGGGPRVVVSTDAFHTRVRGSVPGLGGLKETKNVSSPSTCESQYCGEPL